MWIGKYDCQLYSGIEEATLGLERIIFWLVVLEAGRFAFDCFMQLDCLVDSEELVIML